MIEVDKVHQKTERIYKSLSENFNPSLKNFIQAGKNYQKQLNGVSNAAKQYFDALTRLTKGVHNAQGSIGDIAAAIIQIAEVDKEIYRQTEENIKSFHTELLIPLETKENEFKNILNTQKKYAQGQKSAVSRYNKTDAALKKSQKKSKSKGYPDAKENQCIQAHQESKSKLDKHVMLGYHDALLEQRKRYCFVLDKLSTMVRNYASHHSKAHEMLTHRLPEWSDLCMKPNELPPSEDLIANDGRRGSIPGRENGDDRQHSFDYDHHQLTRSGSVPPNGRISLSDYSSAHLDYTAATMPRLNHSLAATPSLQSQVRALYSHIGSGDNQLTFNQGDVIMLIGETKDGWHYGENTVNNSLGWFPVSFTEPIHVTDVTGRQRVKSMNDLLDPNNMADNQDSGGDSYYSDTRSMTLPHHTVVNHPEVNEGHYQESVPRHNRIAGLPGPPDAPPPPPVGINDPPPMRNHHSKSMPTLTTNVPQVDYDVANLPPPPPLVVVNDQPNHPPSRYAPKKPSPLLNRHPYGQRMSMPQLQPSKHQRSTSHYGYQSQQPPSMPPPLPPQAPPADYEDNTDSNQDNAFSKVKLRKSFCNDRSAPKIH